MEPSTHEAESGDSVHGVYPQRSEAVAAARRSRVGRGRRRHDRRQGLGRAVRRPNPGDAVPAGFDRQRHHDDRGRQQVRSGVAERVDVPAAADCSARGRQGHRAARVRIRPRFRQSAVVAGFGDRGATDWSDRVAVGRLSLQLDAQSATPAGSKPVPPDDQQGGAADLPADAAGSDDRGIVGQRIDRALAVRCAGGLAHAPAGQSFPAAGELRAGAQSGR